MSWLYGERVVEEERRGGVFFLKDEKERWCVYEGKWLCVSTKRAALFPVQSALEEMRPYGKVVLVILIWYIL